MNKPPLYMWLILWMLASLIIALILCLMSPAHAEAASEKVGVAEAKENQLEICSEYDKRCPVWSFSLPQGKAKQVVTEYEDFLQIIAIKEHSEKLKNQALAEKGVLLKLKDEQGSIIKVQADQIKACEAIVHEQEKIGATQDQINQAVGIELGRVKTELDREKRLSRYKSEAFWLGVMGVVWLLN